MVVAAELFVAVAHDLAVGLRQAYDELQIADRTPAIGYTHGNVVPHDTCDRAWITLATTQANPLAQPCVNVPLATYRIEVVRCWPTPDSQGHVSYEAERAAAEGLQVDAAALWQLAAINARKELITVPEIGCDALKFLDMRPTGPAGGLAGWTFPVTVAVWGLSQGFN